jgi:peptidoglycan hydrolase CwlO-like protein
MIQLFTALMHANIPELEAKNVLTELENTIHNEVEREFLQMNVSTINPIVREQDGIRNDIRQLSDKLEHEVERLDTKIEYEAERLNNKIDSVEERLNNKIEYEADRLNTKIDSVEERLNAKFLFHDKLLWTIISLLIALSGFVVTNSIFIYQKLK